MILLNIDLTLARLPPPARGEEDDNEGLIGRIFVSLFTLHDSTDIIVDKRTSRHIVQAEVAVHLLFLRLDPLEIKSVLMKG